jgi:hypothetical protein
MRDSHHRLARHLLLPLLLLGGCAGAEKIRSQPLYLGQEVVLDASFEEAKAATRRALVKTGFDLDEEKTVDETTWYAIGELGWAMQSWGEVARVVLVKADPDLTRVTFHSVKKLDSNASEDLEGVRRGFILNLYVALAELQ